MNKRNGRIAAERRRNSATERQAAYSALSHEEKVAKAQPGSNEERKLTARAAKPEKAKK